MTERTSNIIVIGFLGLVLVGHITFSFIKRAIAENEVTITVTDKTVKRYSNNDIYMIYSDEGVFEICDSFAYWRFDSSDTYGNIRIGETYKCTVCGWRIPFLSWYPNIIIAEEVE